MSDDDPRYSDFDPRSTFELLQDALNNISHVLNTQARSEDGRADLQAAIDHLNVAIVRLGTYYERASREALKREKESS